MARKSTIDKLPAAVKTHIEKRLRENRLTLDELIADLQSTFPKAQHPSRSALGRYSQGFEEIMKSHRQIAVASEALVAELGENFDDKSGALLAQAVTTLATNAAMKAATSDELEIKDVLDMARAAKSVQEARSLSRKERHVIAKEARDKLLQEQADKLDSLAAKGMSRDAVDAVKKEILGLAS